MHIGREAETALIIIVSTGVTIATAVLAERRARRRVTTVMAHLPLDRSGYWRVYTDVLKDLGGLGGADSAENPTGG